MQKENSNAHWSPPPDHLDLQPHQVDVWRISLDLSVAAVKSLESTLSEEETQRASRFHFPADRDRYIASHAALHDILARYLKNDPSQLNFSTNDNGKPVLRGNDLEFNLSHSGDLALIAVSHQRKVGVDVERIRPSNEYESIARRFFSPTENAELTALPPEQRISAFFNCWTRKEAYIKAQGLGLSLPLDSFDVSLSPDKPSLLRATRPDQEEASRWSLVSLKAGIGYAAALAVEGRNLDLNLWEWHAVTQ